MKKVTIPEVTKLVAARGTPSISIYMRTGRDGAEGADRARLRALFRRTSDMLAPSLDRDGIEELLLPIALRAREQWPEARSVALLRSPEVTAAFALPVEVPDLAIVSSTFHTKPLVSLFDGGETFSLLAIGQGVARLHQATPDALVPSRRELPAGDVGSAASREAWYRDLDEALCRQLANTEELVVLAGDRGRLDAFRAASRYPWLLDEDLEADLAQVHVRDLLAPAREIVRAHRHDVETEAAVRYLTAAAAGRATDDLSAIARAAVAGRVQLLVHRRGAHVWGRLDPWSGECVVRGVAPEAGDADLLDDLCEIVLQHGGDVVEVDGDLMPTSAPAAAVVRSAKGLRRPRHHERAVAV